MVQTRAKRKSERGTSSDAVSTVNVCKRRRNDEPATSLPDLSDDVLLMIMTYGLGVMEIIAMRSMNKRLYGFTKLRSVWRNILETSKNSFMFPISFPLDPDITAKYLERVAVTAFRLQRNFLSDTPSPATTSVVRGRNFTYTSIASVQGEWLLTLQARALAAGSTTAEPNRYTLKLWKVNGSAEPVPLTERDIEVAGCASFLGIQTMQKENLVAIALKGLSYRIYLFLCQLPGADCPPLFYGPLPLPVFPSPYPPIESSPTWHDPQRLSCFSMGHPCYATITPSGNLAVVNWTTGVYTIGDRNLVPWQFPDKACHSVAVKIMDRSVVIVTSYRVELWVVSPGLVRNAPVRLQDMPPHNISMSDEAPLCITTFGIFLGEVPKYKTLAATIHATPIGKNGTNVTVMAVEESRAPEFEWEAAPRRAVIHQIFLLQTTSSPLHQLISYGGRIENLGGGHLPVEGLLRRIPFSHPPPFHWQFGANGARALWFSAHHATRTTRTEDRLTIWVFGKDAVLGNPKLRSSDEETSYGPLIPEKSEERPLFTSEFAATLKLRDRQKFNNASCVAYDDVRGRLFVATTGGELFVVSYADGWPDEAA